MHYRVAVRWWLGNRTDATQHFTGYRYGYKGSNRVREMNASSPRRITWRWSQFGGWTRRRYRWIGKHKQRSAGRAESGWNNSKKYVLALCAINGVFHFENPLPIVCFQRCP